MNDDLEVYQAVPRFFSDFDGSVDIFPTEFSIEDDFVVQHIRTVLRLKPNNPVVVVDAQREIAYTAILKEIAKDTITLCLKSCLETPPTLALPRKGGGDFSPSKEGSQIEPSTEEVISLSSIKDGLKSPPPLRGRARVGGEYPPMAPITLAVALIKEQRWDWLLQKATELGVRSIQPLLTERCIIRLYEKDIPKKQMRWGLIARSAAEQSEGLFIPTIQPPLSTKDWLKSLNNTPGPVPPLKLLGQERGKNRASLKTVLSEFHWDRPVVITIGPEGGWAATELTAFQEAGFVSVSLGGRVLRTETAAVMAMAALLYAKD